MVNGVTEMWCSAFGFIRAKNFIQTKYFLIQLKSAYDMCMLSSLFDMFGF